METTFLRIRGISHEKMKTDPRVQSSAKQWPRLCKPRVLLITLGVGEECQAVKKQQLTTGKDLDIQRQALLRILI